VNYQTHPQALGQDELFPLSQGLLSLDRLRTLTSYDERLPYKLGVRKLNLFHHVKEAFSWGNAVATLTTVKQQNPGAIDYGQKNPLDDIWVGWEDDPNAGGTGEWHHWFPWRRKVRTPDKAQYWRTLDSLRDPWVYIEYLAHWLPAGINLMNVSPRGSQVPDYYLTPDKRPKHGGKAGTTYHGSSRVWNQLLSCDWMPSGYNFFVDKDGLPEKYTHKPASPSLYTLLGAAQDQELYSQYVDRWEELITTDVLQWVSLVKQLSAQEDLRTLLLAESDIVNRIALITGVPVKTNTEARDIKLVASIPQEFRTVHRFTITDEKSGHERTMYTQIPLKYQNRLAEIYRRAIPLLQANLLQLAARIKQLEDTSVTLQPNLDPRTNFFLVPDLAATARAGQPVYTNVAANLTAGWATGGKYTPPEEIAAYLPSAEHILAAPEVLKRMVRYIETPEGATFSKQDIEGLPKKEGSIIPLLLGAAAGGLALFAATR